MHTGGDEKLHLRKDGGEGRAGLASAENFLD